MSQLFTNNATTTLAAAVTSNSQTSLTLVSGKGALFPNPASPDFFLITLDDGTNVEIAKVTARSTDTLTVVRGQEGTTAQSSFAVGTKVELRLTAGSYFGSMARETFSNAAVTILGTADRYVAQIGTMSAARTVTLPAASGRSGQRIIIKDESGSVTQAYKLTIARAGTDTLGPGAVQNSMDLFTAGSTLELVSDGVSKWTVVKLSTQVVEYLSGTTAWVAPPGVCAPDVLLVGGGGNGGAVGAGGGGGGGGMIVNCAARVTPGTSYNVVIGAGGGNASTFGALLTAPGGGDGGSTTSGLGGRYGNLGQNSVMTGTSVLPGHGGKGLSSGGGMWGPGGASGSAGAGGGGSYGAGGAGAATSGADGGTAAANTGGGGGGAGLGLPGAGGSGYCRLTYGV